MLFTLEADRSRRFKELQRNIPVAASPASSHDLTGYDIVAGKESLSKKTVGTAISSLSDQQLVIDEESVPAEWKSEWESGLPPVTAVPVSASSA